MPNTIRFVHRYCDELSRRRPFHRVERVSWPCMAKPVAEGMIAPTPAPTPDVKRRARAAPECPASPGIDADYTIPIQTSRPRRALLGRQRSLDGVKGFLQESGKFPWRGTLH